MEKERRREQVLREKEVVREFEDWKAQLYLLLDDSLLFFSNLESQVLQFFYFHSVHFFMQDWKAGKLSAELKTIKVRKLKEDTVRKSEFNKEMDTERTELEESASSMRSNLKRRLRELKKSDSRPPSAIQSPAAPKLELLNGSAQKTKMRPETNEEDKLTTMMKILEMQEEGPTDEVKENGGRRKSSLLEQVRQWKNPEGETEDPTEGETTEDYFSFSEDEGEDPFNSSPKLPHIRRKSSFQVPSDRKSSSFPNHQSSTERQ